MNCKVLCGFCISSQVSEVPQHKCFAREKDLCTIYKVLHACQLALVPFPEFCTKERNLLKQSQYSSPPFCGRSLWPPVGKMKNLMVVGLCFFTMACNRLMWEGGTRVSAAPLSRQ